MRTILAYMAIILIATGCSSMSVYSSQQDQTDPVVTSIEKMEVIVANSESSSMLVMGVGALEGEALVNTKSQARKSFKKLGCKNNRPQLRRLDWRVHQDGALYRAIAVYAYRCEY